MGNPTAVKVGPGLLYINSVGAPEPASLSDEWDTSWVPLGYTDEGHAFSSQVTTEGVEVAEEQLPIRQETTGIAMSVAFALAEMTAQNLSYALNGGELTDTQRFVSDAEGVAVVAAINATTDTFTTAVNHDLNVGDPVKLGTITTTTGVVAGTTYYVIEKTAKTFKLSATPLGSSLAMTTDGSALSVAEQAGLIVFEPPEAGEEVRVALGWESQDHTERWVWRKCVQTGNVEIARRKAPAKATIPCEFALEIVAGGVKPFKAIFDDSDNA